MLRALEGEDAAEAERVLAEHVPTCPRCRSILDELEETAGDLALAAGPAPPPELLLTRLHREIRETGHERRRPVGSWIWMAAAVTVVGLTVWNAVLHTRLSNEMDTKRRISTAMGVLSQPGYRTVSFDTTRKAPSHMRAAFRPGDARVVRHAGHREHEIVVFEANGYAGGHTNTIRVDTEHETHQVDTGFIVMNDRNYPTFTRLALAFFRSSA